MSAFVVLTPYESPEKSRGDKKFPKIPDIGRLRIGYSVVCVLNHFKIKKNDQKSHMTFIFSYFLLDTVANFCNAFFVRKESVARERRSWSYAGIASHFCARQPKKRSGSWT